MKKSALKSITALAVALCLGTSVSAQTILWSAGFESPDGTAAVQSDDGGTVGTFYGGGDPFFQNDAAVIADDESVATGNNSTNAMLVELDPLTTGVNYTFFGTFLQCAEGTLGTNTGLDVSSGDVLMFDLRLGAPGAVNQFAVKLEDVVPTGGGEFNNTNAPITPNPVDTAWTSYSFPLSTFTGGAQPVDLTVFSQVTIEANPAPTGGGDVTFSLQVDNVQIASVPTAVQDWQMFE